MNAIFNTASISEKNNTEENANIDRTTYSISFHRIYSKDYREVKYADDSNAQRLCA